MKLLSTKICMKKDLGVHNNLFGGIMLSWIDESAVAYATEFCQTPNIVTVKMNEVNFLSPVKENLLIKIYGDVIRIGNTSVTLAIEARKFNVYTQIEKPVTSTEITFVRIDEEGRPIPIAEEVKAAFEAST